MAFRDWVAQVPIFGKYAAPNTRSAVNKKKALENAWAMYDKMSRTAPAERIAAGRATAQAYNPSAALLNEMSGGRYEPSYDKMFRDPNPKKKKKKPVSQAQISALDDMARQGQVQGDPGTRK